MYIEWPKPREYSFMNAAGEVFHEIVYSWQDLNMFAKMHKAVRYKPTQLFDRDGREIVWRTKTPSRKTT
jgi:hypothetical protein